MVQGQQMSHPGKKKKKLDLNPLSHTRINSKWIKDLNIKAKTILEEIMGELSWSKSFFCELTSKRKY